MYCTGYKDVHQRNFMDLELMSGRFAKLKYSNMRQYCRISSYKKEC